jgi:hypothetical protein
MWWCGGGGGWWLVWLQGVRVRRSGKHGKAGAVVFDESQRLSELELAHNELLLLETKALRLPGQMLLQCYVQLPAAGAAAAARRSASVFDGKTAPATLTAASEVKSAPAAAAPASAASKDKEQDKEKEKEGEAPPHPFPGYEYDPPLSSLFDVLRLRRVRVWCVVCDVCNAVQSGCEHTLGVR